MVLFNTSQAFSISVFIVSDKYIIKSKITWLVDLFFYLDILSDVNVMLIMFIDVMSCGWNIS